MPVIAVPYGARIFRVPPSGVNTEGLVEQKRTFSMEGGNLVVETSAPTRNGGAPSITKVTYKKYERGYGG